MARLVNKSEPSIEDVAQVKQAAARDTINASKITQRAAWVKFRTIVSSGNINNLVARGYKDTCDGLGLDPKDLYQLILQSANKSKRFTLKLQ